METLSLPHGIQSSPVHFYPLSDAGDPFAPSRLETYLPPVVEAALRDAALDADERRALPVFLGSSCFNVRDSEVAYARALDAGAADAIPMPYTDMGSLARYVCTLAGSHGPDFSFNTACSSAAHALLVAARYLRAGLARNALVVGVELANLTSLAGFSALQLLTDRIAPFGEQRDGIVLGEGIAAVVLQADTTARLRLLGGASQVDTHAIATSNPDGHSLASVMHAALRDSDTEPAAVRAIKAHATGTPSNDEAEALGLHHVFPAMPPVCVLKQWIGHTLGACGVVELVLFAGALEQGFVPGALYEKPDPLLAVTPLAQPVAAVPGRYLLNQFGFGGNNNVLALEMAC